MVSLGNITHRVAAIAALALIGAAAPHAAAQGPLVSWGADSYGPSGSFIAVAAGDYHTVAIREDGTLTSWGNAGPLPAGTFSAVASSAAIRTDGTLVSWGVAGEPPAGTFTVVATGEHHGVAIRTDGTLASWGDELTLAIIYGVPDLVSGTPTGTFVAVAAGLTHSVAIRTDGTVVVWGSYVYGPAGFAPAGTFSAVAAGADHDVAIRTDGTLAIWNYWGLGTGPAGTFSAVAARGYNNVAIRADATLLSWGDDTYNQVSGTPAGRFLGIAAGSNHSVAIAVVDNLPPVITCNGPVALWLPNHELVDVRSAFSVSDPNGDPVTLTFRVFSDETEVPDTGDGTGRHAPDFKTVLGSCATGLFVRSERRANGNGRFYVAVVTADDGHGGATRTACALAVCPRDQNQQSLNDVRAEADIAATYVQALVDTEALPPSGQAPAGMLEHGIASQLGPFQ